LLSKQPPAVRPVPFGPDTCPQENPQSRASMPRFVSRVAVLLLSHRSLHSSIRVCAVSMVPLGGTIPTRRPLYGPYVVGTSQARFSFARGWMAGLGMVRARSATGASPSCVAERGGTLIAPGPLDGRAARRRVGDRNRSGCRRCLCRRRLSAHSRCRRSRLPSGRWTRWRRSAR
jgi:hypothetical protein